MATVFWKGKQWVAQWYRPDGSRPKRGTGIGAGKKREAKRIADEMESKDRKEKTDTGRKFEEIVSRAGADAKAGRLSGDRATEYVTEIRKVSDPSFRVVSFITFLEGWCSEKSHRVEQSTATGYLDMKRRFSSVMPTAVLDAQISDLTRAQIEKAVMKLKERPDLKASTINLDIRALRQALKQAHEDGLIPKNPASGIKALPETDSDEVAPFDAGEVRSMISHEQTTDEWQGAILFGGHTGLRLGDIVKLGPPHIEGTDLVIRPTKTKRTKKVIRIPLSPPVLGWIGKRKGPFFPTLSKLKTPTLSMQFKAIMKRAGVAAAVTLPGGIEAKRSFHSLRHSFNTWLTEADIHADVRKKLTGHSDDKSHGRYSHHDEALKRAIGTLPDIGTPQGRKGA